MTCLRPTLSGCCSATAPSRGLKFNWGYDKVLQGQRPGEQIRRRRETGCTKIHFGVESANNEGLDARGHRDTDDVHRVFKWCREVFAPSPTSCWPGPTSGPWTRRSATSMR